MCVCTRVSVYNWHWVVASGIFIKSIIRTAIAKFQLKAAYHFFRCSILFLFLCCRLRFYRPAACLPACLSLVQPLSHPHRIPCAMVSFSELMIYHFRTTKNFSLSIHIYKYIYGFFSRLSVFVSSSLVFLLYCALVKLNYWYSQQSVSVRVLCGTTKNRFPIFSLHTQKMKKRRTKKIFPHTNRTSNGSWSIDSIRRRFFVVVSFCFSFA